MILDIQGAAAALRVAKDVLILTHKRPDGDTAGCAGALCRGLRQLNKKAYIMDNSEVTKRYAALITPCYPPEDFVPKYIVAVDTAEERLFTQNSGQYKGNVDLVIDHHPSNGNYGKDNLVIPECGACAEIVYDVLMELGVRITINIAECLYVGVSTDTGCFKYSNTTVHSHEVAAVCLSAGLDGGEINRRLFEAKSFTRFQIERILFDTMEFYENGKVALAMIWRDDIDRLNADRDDMDSIASLTRQIEGVEVGITLTENDDKKKVRLSVRTSGKVNASKICEKFGGGGHMRAAGAGIDCGMKEAKKMVLNAVQEALNAGG